MLCVPLCECILLTEWMHKTGCIYIFSIHIYLISVSLFWPLLSDEFSCHQMKKVKKLYLALAAAPVPIGIIAHYMRPVNMAPRLISEGNHLILA